MLNLLLTPEALPITTVGLFLMLCTVGWSIKTIFNAIFN